MMNWIFGRPKSNLPEPTALQTQRVKQIEQLKSFNQNVSEIQRDVEYRVNFIVSGTTVSLYITLPAQFPQDKPVVKVAPPLRHPWVNEQMIVTGSSGINSFVVHSDLGKVIRQVVEEFQRNPPTLLPQQSYPSMPYPVNPTGAAPAPVPGYPGYPPPNYMPSVPMPTLPAGSATGPAAVHSGSGATSSMYPAPPTVSQTPVPAMGSYHPPEIPSTFQQLNDLSVQELQRLSEDEDELLQMILKLPQLQKIAEDREQLCRANEQLARDNLSKKPLLEDKKRLLLEKYDQLNDMRRKFDENTQKQDAVREQFDPQTIQANLKVAALQAEEEAEHIAEKFLQGDMPIEEFNLKYMDKRKLSHLRKAKEEKLSQFVVHNRTGF